MRGIYTSGLLILVGAAVLALVGSALVMPNIASAKKEFSGQTGLPCGQCHVNPADGGKLTSFGKKFKANGFKLKK